MSRPNDRTDAEAFNEVTETDWLEDAVNELAAHLGDLAARLASPHERLACATLQLASNLAPRLAAVRGLLRVACARMLRAVEAAAVAGGASEEQRGLMDCARAERAIRVALRELRRRRHRFAGGELEQLVARLDEAAAARRRALYGATGAATGGVAA